ncbi:uncharacterized protein UTRI_05688_B [Ustilago trichophora]|uniref:ER transporter 6TM N-terminal domain-containing protein n=1 Tax=Ustilago trichophora TaxID=86804 RepID=A0A5C3EQW6_9BASI|nr:uncharacterized protein UTRI_05688_B [Ustilago trichophora]
MDSSQSSHPGQDQTGAEAAPDSALHGSTDEQAGGNAAASIPAISVTRMGSLSPAQPSVPTERPSLNHINLPSSSSHQEQQSPDAVQQFEAQPELAISQASPPLDAANTTNTTTNHSSTFSSDHQQGTRNRARARNTAAGATAAESTSTTADIDQAEKQPQQQSRQQQSSSANDDTNKGKRKPSSSRAKRHWKRFAKMIGFDPLPWYISWIFPCLTWPKLKPVIRSSLLAWICMLLLLIGPTERALGSASFLVIVASFIMPAEAPLAAVVEREFFTLLFVCAAWAWSVIATAIAHAARNNKVPRAQASIQRAIKGDYIEAAPSIVCAVFLSIGSAVVLYVKIRFGPGPFLFASVLSCILMNISLTYAPLYPFPFYTLGQSVVVPLALKAAINIFLSVVFFPKSVNSQFVERLVAVLNPIAAACGDQVKLLQTSPLDTPSKPDSTETEGSKESKDGFDFEFVKNKLSAAEGGLVPMAMASRLLTREISFGLASGDDLKALERLSRSLIAPADGWSYYYSSIKADIQLAHFPRTPVPSRLATPAITPAITPRTSLEHSRDHSELGHASQRDAAHQASGHRDSLPQVHYPQLHPPSRPHSPALTPLTPFATANPAPHHDASHMLVPASGTSTPHRESPLHGEVFPHDASNAAGFRQLDEHPSVQPGNEFTSSRFRKMARSIAAASRSSSPRRWIHHGHHSSVDVRDHAHHHHDGRHNNAWDRSNQLLHNFVHKRDPAPVAIWESIRFGNLETYLHTPASNYITEMFAQLVRETSSDLLTADAEAIKHIVAWLTYLNSHRYTFLHDCFFLSQEKRAEKGRKQADETSKVIASVEAKLTEFRQSQRLKVLDPYRDALRAHGEAALSSTDLTAELDLRTGPGEIGKIHHRYLYQAWLHQFHTISFTERLLQLLREIETLQRQRTSARVWFPHWPRMFSVDAWRNSSADVHEADEPDGDPDHIPDITNDTPAASRQQSRGSHTVVDHDDSSNDKSQAKGGKGEKTGDKHAHMHAHAHFRSADYDHDHDRSTTADGVGSDPIVDLGSTRARDPDALDPEGFLQVVGHTIYFWTRRPFQGNFLFGVKAAVLIALVSLPAFMKSSAGWCYENRAIWAIFMAQLTLARFRGETAFALLSRILATIIGVIFGLIIWYISTGDGRGNAYGLGATTAVAFPLVMMYRIYFPGPPITPIIASVTTALIVGYSWKDVTNPTPGAPGYGWDTAWRRFVTVVIGVSAAYIFSYLPPSSTLRQYQRLSHGATIAELGKIYCAVVGIASHPHQQQHQQQQQQSHAVGTKSAHMQSRPGSRRPSLHQTEAPESVAHPEEHHLLNVHPSSELVRKRIIAVRAKLRRLSMISVNVSYEFSLRGRWPAARYRELLEVQMQISKLLSHCLAILERLGPAYSIALLRRTRFLDPRFLGDVVSVISMCSTALKTGQPLPQITPCPLVDRFMDTPHGFNAYLPTEGSASSGVDEILATLPAKITMATLEDAEYMTFSVGVATLFGLVMRIDKLCVAVKELVGESYAVPVDVHRMLRRNGN